MLEVVDLINSELFQNNTWGFLLPFAGSGLSAGISSTVGAGRDVDEPLSCQGFADLARRTWAARVRAGFQLQNPRLLSP